MADLWRTYYSFKKGYITLRIPNCLTSDEKTIEQTADAIVGILKAGYEQLERKVNDDLDEYYDNDLGD